MTPEKTWITTPQKEWIPRSENYCLYENLADAFGYELSCYIHGKWVVVNLWRYTKDVKSVTPKEFEDGKKTKEWIPYKCNETLQNETGLNWDLTEESLCVLVNLDLNVNEDYLAVKKLWFEPKTRIGPLILGSFLLQVHKLKLLPSLLVYYFLHGDVQETIRTEAENNLIQLQNSEFVYLGDTNKEQFWAKLVLGCWCWEKVFGYENWKYMGVVHFTQNPRGAPFQDHVKHIQFIHQWFYLAYYAISAFFIEGISRKLWGLLETIVLATIHAFVTVFSVVQVANMLYDNQKEDGVKGTTKNSEDYGDMAIRFVHSFACYFFVGICIYNWTYIRALVSILNENLAVLRENIGTIHEFTTRLHRWIVLISAGVTLAQNQFDTLVWVVFFRLLIGLGWHCESLWKPRCYPGKMKRCVAECAFLVVVLLINGLGDTEIFHFGNYALRFGFFWCHGAQFLCFDTIVTFCAYIWAIFYIERPKLNRPGLWTFSEQWTEFHLKECIFEPASWFGYV